MDDAWMRRIMRMRKWDVMDGYGYYDKRQKLDMSWMVMIYDKW
jgi:hypothetical protein